MSRWKASGIHLLISIGIGLIVAALLFKVWYPPPYFRAGGADRLVLLLVGIDLALGPLLTLAVFKAGKRGLKFDLAVIGTLQLGALVYGLSVICESRPVFLVGAVDRFNLVAANSIAAADLALGKKPEFRQLSWTGPKLVAARSPTDPQQKFDLAVSATQGRDIENQPVFYVDYDEQAAELAKRARSIDEIRRHVDDEGRRRLADAIAALGRDEAQLAWLPIVARQTDLVMLIERDSGKVLRPLALNPW